MNKEISHSNSNMEEISINNDEIRSSIKYRELAKELVRYSFVGISSFIIDAFTLYLCENYVFNNTGEIGVLFSSAIGFIVGLVYNYVMSIKFVFKSVDNTKSSTENFIIFTIIGIVWFLLTQIGMIIGMKILSLEYYMPVKIVVALIVFVWNYTARKIMVFR